jgi:hypothetical protein
MYEEDCGKDVLLSALSLCVGHRVYNTPKLKKRINPVEDKLKAHYEKETLHP